MAERDIMNFDIVIVGAGPAGLASAIRIKQLAPELAVCVLEKGSEVGAHILSGAVIEPRALDELLPDWKERGAPLNSPVTSERFLLLTESGSIRLPTPPQMKNHGNYIASLGNLCRWMAERAAELGVEIYPGFPAAEVIYGEHGEVRGVITGDLGRAADGSEKETFQQGMELHAKYTLFAEGCRGSLTQTLFEKFDLRQECDPQNYGIGIKELWEVPAEVHKQGTVIHTVGWPLDNHTYGGSFLYHLENNQIAVGFVVGLDYENPYLNPFQEMQRFKTHPTIRKYFEKGKRIAYGARAINEGGLQAIPTLTFQGGAIIGCGAGFVNVPKIKGSHTAMKTGMLAAEAAVEAIQADRANDRLTTYSDKVQKSWVYEELHKVRNIKPSFKKGLWAGMLYSAIDTYLLRGKAPWTFSLTADHLALKKANECNPIAYLKPDGKLTFDLLSSVYISNTNHTENQPVHLRIKDASVPESVNLPLYDAPESRFCPAGVYEFVAGADGKKHLHINAQNCVHCKTCDIKDPTQNIQWVTPEGGGGPNYPAM